jgi:hypothetical protein
MLNYERDYVQKNNETDTEPNVQEPPVVPRINSELFCQRKESGIYHRSAAFRDHRRDFGVAHCRSGWRHERISPKHSDVKKFVSH